MRSLICFDIESTGTDPAKDRIVSLALCAIDGTATGSWLINPGFGNWMLDRDFTQNTKMHLSRILYGEPVEDSVQVADKEGMPF